MDPSAALERRLAELQDSNERLKREAAERERALAACERRAEAAERRAADAEESRRFLEALLEYVPEGIVISEGPEVRIRAVSAYAVRMAGVPREAIEGTSLKDRPETVGIYRMDGRTLVAPEELPLTRATRQGAVTLDEEFTLRRPDGEQIIISAHAGPVRDQTGKIVGAVLSWVDITERKRAEREREELLRSEQAAREEAESAGARFRGLLESAPDGIAIVNANSRMVLANAQLSELSGYSREELIGKPVEMLVPERFREKHRGYHAGYLADPHTRPMGAGLDLFVRRKDGSELPVEISLSPMRTQQGLLVTAIVRDRTPRRRAEEALRASEERYRTLAEAAQDSIFIIGRDDAIEYVNSYGAAQFGCRPEQMVGKPRADLWPPEVSGRLKRNLDRVMETGEPLYREDPMSLLGREVWLHTSLVPLKDQTGAVRGVLGIARDITQMKGAEEALRESEERYRTLVELSPDMIVVTDGVKFLFVNPAGARLLGLTSPEELIGKPILSIVHPDYAEVVAARLRQAVEEGKPAAPLEERLVRRDGTTVEAEVTGAPITYQGKHAAQYVIRDISARKRLDEERLQLLKSEQEARAQAEAANNAKDQFIAAVSHELRNPLAPILAGVDVLRRASPQDERARRTLEVIERNVKLQARLVNDLLDLSRITRGKIHLQRAPVALDAVVRAVVQDQQEQAEKAGLSLHIATVPGLWVLGDFDRLHQVVLNLLTNAIKFTPSGEVRVSVQPADGRGRIVVEDTGIGIDRALLPHLFEVFRQGEVAGARKPGLGIGLSLVKSLTEAHGGQVWAESEGPGEGSRFTVELPLVTGPAATHPAVFAEEAPGRYSLLLVEDNPDTLAVLGDGLGVAGYEVRGAASAEEALEILRQVKPDVILADINLPGIDGYEFLRRARQMPGLAEVLAFAVTGFGTDEDVRRAREAGYGGHFVKPVDIGALDARIREWLKAQAASPGA